MQTPPPDTWADSLLLLLTTHIALTEPIVFALGFAESIVFLSLLVPSTVLFLAIGGTHSALGGVFWPVWLAGAGGAILGDILSYAVGAHLKKKVTRVWPLSKNPRWVAYARLSVTRYGIAGVTTGKFLGMARPFIPVIAGSMRMPWQKFLLASVISSLLWAGLFLAPGYGIAWFMS